MIKLIVAVDSNYGIGYNNELLFRIKEDLQHFRKLTTGNFVIMGRKTYESLPSALPERMNVVLTRDRGYKPKESKVIIEHDINRIIAYHNQTGEQDKDIWIIGGAEVYKAFMDHADEVHLTCVHKEAEYADTYFSANELNRSFEKTSSHKIFSEKENCELTFMVYKRKL